LSFELIPESILPFHHYQSLLIINNLDIIILKFLSVELI